jgi:hypothetical protein
VNDIVDDAGLVEALAESAKTVAVNCLEEPEATSYSDVAKSEPPEVKATDSIAQAEF